MSYVKVRYEWHIRHMPSMSEVKIGKGGKAMSGKDAQEQVWREIQAGAFRDVFDDAQWETIVRNPTDRDIVALYHLRSRFNTVYLKIHRIQDPILDI